MSKDLGEINSAIEGAKKALRDDPLSMLLIQPALLDNQYVTTPAEMDLEQNEQSGAKPFQDRCDALISKYLGLVRPWLNTRSVSEFSSIDKEVLGKLYRLARNFPHSEALKQDVGGVTLAQALENFSDKARAAGVPYAENYKASNDTEITKAYDEVKTVLANFLAKKGLRDQIKNPPGVEVQITAESIRSDLGIKDKNVVRDNLKNLYNLAQRYPKSPALQSIKVSGNNPMGWLSSALGNVGSSTLDETLREFAPVAKALGVGEARGYGTDFDPEKIQRFWSRADVYNKAVDEYNKHRGIDQGFEETKDHPALSQLSDESLERAINELRSFTAHHSSLASSPSAPTRSPETAPDHASRLANAQIVVRASADQLAARGLVVEQQTHDTPLAQRLGNLMLTIGKLRMPIHRTFGYVALLDQLARAAHTAEVQAAQEMIQAELAGVVSQLPAQDQTSLAGLLTDAPAPAQSAMVTTKAVEPVQVNMLDIFRRLLEDKVLRERVLRQVSSIAAIPQEVMRNLTQQFAALSTQLGSVQRGRAIADAAPVPTTQPTVPAAATAPAVVPSVPVAAIAPTVAHVLEPLSPNFSTIPSDDELKYSAPESVVGRVLTASAPTSAPTRELSIVAETSSAQDEALVELRDTIMRMVPDKQKSTANSILARFGQDQQEEIIQKILRLLPDKTRSTQEQALGAAFDLYNNPGAEIGGLFPEGKHVADRRFAVGNEDRFGTPSVSAAPAPVVQPAAAHAPEDHAPIPPAPPELPPLPTEPYPDSMPPRKLHKTELNPAVLERAEIAKAKAQSLVIDNKEQLQALASAAANLKTNPAANAKATNVISSTIKALKAFNNQGFTAKTLHSETLLRMNQTQLENYTSATLIPFMNEVDNALRSIGLTMTWNKTLEGKRGSPTVAPAKVEKTGVPPKVAHRPAPAKATTTPDKVAHPAAVPPVKVVKRGGDKHLRDDRPLSPLVEKTKAQEHEELKAAIRQVEDNIRRSRAVYPQVLEIVAGSAPTERQLSNERDPRGVASVPLPAASSAPTTAPAPQQVASTAAPYPSAPSLDNQLYHDRLLSVGVDSREPAALQPVQLASDPQVRQIKLANQLNTFLSGRGLEAINIEEFSRLPEGERITVLQTRSSELPSISAPTASAPAVGSSSAAPAAAVDHASEVKQMKLTWAGVAAKNTSNLSWFVGLNNVMVHDYHTKQSLLQAIETALNDQALQQGIKSEGPGPEALREFLRKILPNNQFVKSLRVAPAPEKLTPAPAPLPADIAVSATPAIRAEQVPAAIQDARDTAAAPAALSPSTLTTIRGDTSVSPSSQHTTTGDNFMSKDKTDNNEATQKNVAAARIAAAEEYISLFNSNVSNSTTLKNFLKKLVLKKPGEQKHKMVADLISKRQITIDDVANLALDFQQLRQIYTPQSLGGLNQHINTILDKAGLDIRTYSQDVAVTKVAVRERRIVSPDSHEAVPTTPPSSPTAAPAITPVFEAPLLPDTSSPQVGVLETKGNDDPTEVSLDDRKAAWSAVEPYIDQVNLGLRSGLRYFGTHFTHALSDGYTADQQKEILGNAFTQNHNLSASLKQLYNQNPQDVGVVFGMLNTMLPKNADVAQLIEYSKAHARWGVDLRNQRGEQSLQVQETASPQPTRMQKAAAAAAGAANAAGNAVYGVGKAVGTAFSNAFSGRSPAQGEDLTPTLQKMPREMGMPHVSQKPKAAASSPANPAGIEMKDIGSARPGGDSFSSVSSLASTASDELREALLGDGGRSRSGSVDSTVSTDGHGSYTPPELVINDDEDSKDHSDLPSRPTSLSPLEERMARVDAGRDHPAAFSDSKSNPKAAASSRANPEGIEMTDIGSARSGGDSVSSVGSAVSAASTSSIESRNPHGRTIIPGSLEDKSDSNLRGDAVSDLKAAPSTLAQRMGNAIAAVPKMAVNAMVRNAGGAKSDNSQALEARQASVAQSMATVAVLNQEIDEREVALKVQIRNVMAEELYKLAEQGEDYRKVEANKLVGVVQSRLGVSALSEKTMASYAHDLAKNQRFAMMCEKTAQLIVESPTDILPVDKPAMVAKYAAALEKIGAKKLDDFHCLYMQGEARQAKMLHASGILAYKRDYLNMEPADFVRTLSGRLGSLIIGSDKVAQELKKRESVRLSEANKTLREMSDIVERESLETEKGLLSLEMEEMLYNSSDYRTLDFSPLIAKYRQLGNTKLTAYAEQLAKPNERFKLMCRVVAQRKLASGFVSDDPAKEAEITRYTNALIKIGPKELGDFRCVSKAGITIPGGALPHKLGEDVMDLPNLGRNTDTELVNNIRNNLKANMIIGEENIARAYAEKAAEMAMEEVKNLLKDINQKYGYQVTPQYFAKMEKMYAAQLMNKYHNKEFKIEDLANNRSALIRAFALIVVGKMVEHCRKTTQLVPFKANDQELTAMVKTSLATIKKRDVNAVGIKSGAATSLNDPDQTLLMAAANIRVSTRDNIKRASLAIDVMIVDRIQKTHPKFALDDKVRHRIMEYMLANPQMDYLAFTDAMCTQIEQRNKLNKKHTFGQFDSKIKVVRDASGHHSKSSVLNTGAKLLRKVGIWSRTEGLDRYIELAANSANNGELMFAAYSDPKRDLELFSSDVRSMLLRDQVKFSDKVWNRLMVDLAETLEEARVSGKRMSKGEIKNCLVEALHRIYSEGVVTKDSGIVTEVPSTFFSEILKYKKGDGASLNDILERGTNYKEEEVVERDRLLRERIVGKSELVNLMQSWDRQQDEIKIQAVARDDIARKDAEERRAINAQIEAQFIEKANADAEALKRFYENSTMEERRPRPFRPASIVPPEPGIFKRLFQRKKEESEGAAQSQALMKILRDAQAAAQVRGDVSAPTPVPGVRGGDNKGKNGV